MAVSSLQSGSVRIKPALPLLGMVQNSRIIAAIEVVVVEKTATELLQRATTYTQDKLLKLQKYYGTGN